LGDARDKREGFQDFKDKVHVHGHYLLLWEAPPASGHRWCVGDSSIETPAERFGKGTFRQAGRRCATANVEKSVEGGWEIAQPKPFVA
jgi:hypothetical protein